MPIDRRTIATSIMTVAILVAAGACKRPGGDGTCTKESDCGNGEECVFTEPGCAGARGKCEPGGMTCKVPTPHCTCGDKTVAACVAHEPFKALGPCEHDRPDGKPCTKKEDCGRHGAVCVFEQGCEVPHGACRSIERLNHCKVDPPYCSCSGATHTACEVTEPFKSRGACSSADGGGSPAGR